MASCPIAGWRSIPNIAAKSDCRNSKPRPSVADNGTGYADLSRSDRGRFRDGVQRTLAFVQRWKAPLHARSSVRPQRTMHPPRLSSRANRQLWEHLCRLTARFPRRTTAATGPPPRSFEFTTRGSAAYSHPHSLFRVRDSWLQPTFVIADHACSGPVWGITFHTDDFANLVQQPRLVRMVRMRRVHDAASNGARVENITDRRDGNDCEGKQRPVSAHEAARSGSRKAVAGIPAAATSPSSPKKGCVKNHPRMRDADLTESANRVPPYDTASVPQVP